MAIKKEKILPSGVKGDYWKIISIIYDRLQGQVAYQIALFLGQEQRNSSHLGIVKNFKFKITKEQADGDLTEFGYENIKYQAARLITIPGAQPERDSQGKIKLGEDGKPLPLPTKIFDTDLAGGLDV